MKKRGLIENTHSYCYIKVMIQITSKQRKYLEKSAHDLEPVVIVGGNGVTDSLVNMVAQTLASHELIKVKFNEFKDDRQELSLMISEKTDSTLVRIIGNVAIFYKENEDPEKRQFNLPE